MQKYVLKFVQSINKFPIDDATDLYCTREVHSNRKRNIMRAYESCT